MYVQRNNQGAIIGAFNNLQPDFAEEWLADDAAELVAFLNPQQDIHAILNAQLTAVNEACKAVITGGFACDALGALYHYPSNQIDQLNLSGDVVASLVVAQPGIDATEWGIAYKAATGVNASTGWLTSFWCADASGVWAMRPHSAAQIQQVGLVVRSGIEDAVKKVATLEATLHAIDLTAADAAQQIAAVVWA